MKNFSYYQKNMYYNNYGQPMFPAQQNLNAGPARITPLVTEAYASDPGRNEKTSTASEYFQKNFWWIIAIVVIIIIIIFIGIWWKNKDQETVLNF